MKLNFASILAWLPACVVMGFLFYASHLPGDEVHLPAFPYSDKVVHFLAYAVLGAGISLRFNLHRYLSQQNDPDIVTPAKDYFGCFVGIGYGLSDEIHQLFIPMRHFGLGDLSADMLGVIVGSTTYLSLARKVKRSTIH